MLEHSLKPYTKINSKWFRDLDVRLETIDFLEENIGKTFSDINDSSIFLDPFPKAKEIKAKINKWDLFTLKLLHNKVSHKQNDETAYRLGEKYLQMM